MCPEVWIWGCSPAFYDASANCANTLLDVQPCRKVSGHLHNFNLTMCLCSTTRPLLKGTQRPLSLNSPNGPNATFLTAMGAIKTHNWTPRKRSRVLVLIDGGKHSVREIS